MKERPILFSAPMVRALLDGSKKQTRRVVKDLPPWEITEICHDAGGTGKWMPNGPSPSGRGMAAGHWRLCPYGQPGDRLWVRESFQPLFAEGWKHGVGDHVPDFGTGEGYKVGYPATDGAVEWIDGDDNITSRCKPSIHMPRWASRILLEITSVRVERLNGISEADARAEGVKRSQRAISSTQAAPCFWDYLRSEPNFHSARDSFSSLWEYINGASSWDGNPWCWAITFKRVTP